METTYFSLASKSNFNKALRHFYKVTEVVDEIESGNNLADIVNSQLDGEEIHNDQILPLIGAVLRDKFQYSFDSCAIPANISKFEKICQEIYTWTALDIVIVYYNPNGKVILINPKNQEHWDRARELVRDQLGVVYVKKNKLSDKKLEIEAISTIENMISGKFVKVNKAFIDKSISPKQRQKVKIAAPNLDETEPSPSSSVSAGVSQAKAPSASGKNITPKYAVQVSNELFHNGNVEAWKKIVESYKTKYPSLEVFIFFENEIINDINSLFKWGKVKHGDSIFFQIGGENIVGVSKLQKYLYEGASPRYEQFLKIGVGKVLNLF